MICFWVTKYPKNQRLKTIAILIYSWCYYLGKAWKGQIVSFLFIVTWGWNCMWLHFLTTYMSGSWYWLWSGSPEGSVTQTLSTWLFGFTTWQLCPREEYHQKDQVKGSHVAFDDLVMKVTQYHFYDRSRLIQIQITWLLPLNVSTKLQEKQMGWDALVWSSLKMTSCLTEEKQCKISISFIVLTGQNWNLRQKNRPSPSKPTGF